MVWDPKLVYQKWPDKIFPMVNVVYSHDGQLGLGRGCPSRGNPPPVVVPFSYILAWAPPMKGTRA